MGVSKRKDGRWQVSFRDEQGRPRSKAFPPTKEGKKAAEEFDLDIKLRKKRGEDLPEVTSGGVHIDELAQLWLDEKKVQGRAVGWLKDWAHIFNSRFLPALAHKPVQQITQADVLAIISLHYADAAQSTRNRYVGYLKSILQYGVDHGLIAINPLARWKKGKEVRRRSSLTLDALRRIRAVAPPHLVWAFEVAWNVPARPGPSDLFALRFDRHVNYERGGVEVFHGKVGRWSFVACSKEFLAALKLRETRHASGFLVEYRGKAVRRLDTALTTAARQAELGYPVCMYDVRHLWITTVLDAGIEPSAIAYMAGTSVEMIHANYYEPHAAERGRAVTLLPKLAS